MHPVVAFLPIIALTNALDQYPAPCSTTKDYALPCYSTPLPALPAWFAPVNRSIPWGSPSFILPNGKLCCDSLTEVRDGIDAVDAQILDLLAQRAGFVREATRFKNSIDAVDIPSRDEEVIQAAVNASSATKPRLPEVIAAGIFGAIINSSIPFEKCVFAKF